MPAKITPRRFRVRPCHGNRAAWILVAIRQNGEESDSYGSFVTSYSLDTLMRAAAYLQLTPRDKIEFVPMESTDATRPE